MRSREQWLELERRLEGMGTRQVMAELGCSWASAVQILRRIRNREYPAEGHIIARHLIKGPPPVWNPHRAIPPSTRYVGLLKEMNRRTLEEVGAELGVTRERVRQLYLEHHIGRTSSVAKERFQKKFTRDQALIFCMGDMTEFEAYEYSGYQKPQLTKYLAEWGLAPFFKNDVRKLQANLGLRRCSRCYVLKKFEHFYEVVIKTGHGGCKECQRKMISAYNQKKKGHVFHIKLGDHYLCSGPMKVANPPKLEWTTDISKATVIKYGQKQMYRLEWIHPDARYIDVTPVAIPLTDKPQVESVPS